MTEDASKAYPLAAEKSQLRGHLEMATRKW